jgi:hypothetical protein
MSRSLRALVAFVLVSFAFSAAACAGSVTGPQTSHISAGQTCDINNSNTC